MPSVVFTLAHTTTPLPYTNLTVQYTRTVVLLLPWSVPGFGRLDSSLEAAGGGGAEALGQTGIAATAEGGWAGLSRP